MTANDEQNTINGLVITYRDVESLRPYKNNPRTHSDAQIDVLVASLREFGWTNPILLDGENGVIAGQGRLMAAKKRGMTSVPCIELSHLTPAQRKAYVITDNQTALRAGWDDDLLRLELESLKLEGLDLELLGFDETELASILNARTVGATDPDDVPPVPVKPVARPGDLWSLGRHFLVCGDATERADVEMLLSGAQPHLMIVDPPYGVEYDPDWRNRADRKSGRPIGARAVGRPVNDHRSDWSAAWNLFPGDVVYQWHAGLRARDTQHALEEAGFEIRAQIIWAKQQFVIGRGHYHVQHEPCWYAVRKGASGHWNGDRSQSTIWNIDKPLKSETGHSTQKPVECMLRPIENNSKPGDAIYDPFLGSGTTAIAAEMTGRRCYAIEISPAFCDLAILRWQNFSEEKATLDGRTFDEVRGARCDPNCDVAEGVAIACEGVPAREECMADGGAIR